MSTWFDEPVTCFACSTTFTARLAHGVHATRAPEVREQLFARTFHRVTCPACATVFTAQRGLVYTDMDRRHWLQVAREDERPRWPELEPATRDIFDRAFTGSPLAQPLCEGMRVRLVFGLEELREKLVIWRANLDDATVECLKLDAVVHEPALLHAQRIVLDEVTADGALALAVDGERQLTIPTELVERYHDDPTLSRRFPELFGGTFVSAHRLLGHRYRWVDPT